MDIARTVSLAVAVCCFGMIARAQERPTEPFDRDVLLAKAEELAKHPYVDVIRHNAPELKLSYDQYRSIRFRSDAAIWNGENRTFTIDLFYPGFIFNIPVNINLVVAKTARRVLFTNDLFESDRERPRGRSGRRVLRVPRARAAEQPRRPGRVPRVSGRKLFSRRGAWSALWIVRARSCRAHCAARGRGVSGLDELLDRAAAGAGRPNRDSCVAPESVRRRGLHVHGQARQRDRSSTWTPRCFPASSSMPSASRP